MHKQWRQVWQGRKVSLDGPPSLAGLLAMDGFDGFGSIRESSWLNYTERLAAELPVEPLTFFGIDKAHRNLSAAHAINVECGARPALDFWA